MSDNSITLVGNVTEDPELRFTPSGRQVANFTVAVNKRFKNNQGSWEDRLDGFFKCNVWGEMAENVAETLLKGTRIVVTGRLQQRSWEDGEGNKRSAIEIQVEEVGPSLRWATAQVQKSQRKSGGDWSNQGQGQGQGQGQSQGGQQGQSQAQGGSQWGGGSQGGGSDWSKPPAQNDAPPASGGSDWGSPAPVGPRDESAEF